MPPRERADVVIVGGGLLGLATAYALRGRREVVVLERETVGHARAGSHGPSRIFRLGYPDPLYVAMARRALDGWRALAAETGTEPLEMTGQLSFGPGADDVFRALTAAGSAAAWLDADAVAQRFPTFAGRGRAVFEPDSGVLAADVALTALRTGASCEVREHVAVHAVADHDAGVEVRTEAGVINARVAVVTAGPWTKSLVPVPTFATLEHVAYVRPRSDANGRPPVDRPPAFIDHRDPAVYGLPTPGSDLYKIALHHAGATVDPDGELRPDPRAVAALEAATRHWLAGFEPVAEEIDTCMYDNTEDEDFIIDRVGNVVVGTGTSGHGFKFGVLLGEMLADLVRKREPAFDLTRFAGPDSEFARRTVAAAGGRRVPARPADLVECINAATQDGTEMADEPNALMRRVAEVRGRVDPVRDRAQRLLVWRIWERMLEIEFVDRSVALAGKAFVSFFPLVIVVAAFAPEHVRSSIFTALTSRLGIRGDALATAKQAFASANDVRRATGVLGLVLTLFFASSFTTAIQRVYLRAWRRPAGGRVGAYTRGPAWLLVVLASMAVLGGLRGVLGNGPGYALFGVVSLATTSALWWFTGWFLLLGEVRWRVLVPSGVITSVALAGFAVSATVWMPDVVTRNEAQFGFFGVALALVTWFSGAAICVLIGACAGAVFAEDAGPVGRLIRGGDADLLVSGARPSLPGPTAVLGLRDAFRPTEEV